MILSSVALPVAASDSTVFQGQFPAFGASGFALGATVEATVSILEGLLVLACRKLTLGFRIAAGRCRKIRGVLRHSCRVSILLV